MMRSGRAQGFTLIEILVSVAILAVLVAVLTATLTGSLGLNRQAQRQLSTTSQAQQLLEQVRGAWADGDLYERACAPVTIPDGYSAQFQSLDSRGNVLGTGTAAAPANIRTANCAAQSVVNAPGGSAPPRMRRLIVASQTGGQDTTLTVDVLEPR